MGVEGCCPIILPRKSGMMGVIRITHGVLPENLLGPFLGLGLLGVLGLVYWVMHGKGKWYFALGKIKYGPNH